MSNGAERTPMWPQGLPTRVCRRCRTFTVLNTCAACGGETLAVTVYNSPGAPAAVKWGLTQKEAEVVALVATGLTNAQVAGELTTSEKTVKQQLHLARHKMGAQTRVEVAVMWYEAERSGSA